MFGPRRFCRFDEQRTQFLSMLVQRFGCTGCPTVPSVAPSQPSDTRFTWVRLNCVQTCHFCCGSLRLFCVFTLVRVDCVFGCSLRQRCQLLVRGAYHFGFVRAHWTHKLDTQIRSTTCSVFVGVVGALVWGVLGFAWKYPSDASVREDPNMEVTVLGRSVPRII